MENNSSHSLKASGVCGLIFLLCVLAENILRAAPVQNNAAISEILAYYTGKSGMLMISHSLYIITIPALLIYAAGLAEYLKDTSAVVMLRAGKSAAVLLVLSFSVVIITDSALTLSAASSQVNNDIINLLFRLHAIAFVINGAVLGTAMIGFGYASHRLNFFPKWLSIAGITGGWLLLISAIPIDSVAMGSVWGIIGLAGFICWLVWVSVSSLKMLKAKMLKA